MPGFLGRAREIEQLDALTTGDARLVTLVGPGGVGKTSLALVVAQGHAERRPSAGVWFCDLAESRTAPAVVAAIARALRVELSRGDTDADALVRIGTALDGRGAGLVVLDNCEQALVPIAEAVSVFLQRAPRWRWLATSREPLGLRAEQVYPVLPLSLPSSAVAAAESDAVRLFEACVRRRAPGHRMDDEQLAMVARVVERLDGLPLAIELAAARAARLGVATVLSQLDRPLDILAGGAGDAAARQRTMRRALGWSWDLLDARERTLLEACSVFRGPFTPEAAIEVAALPSGAAPPVDVLHALIDKSMLDATTATGGSPTLRCYQVVRAFSLERLEASGELEAVRARHSEYHARLARASIESSQPREQGAAAADLADHLAALEVATAAATSDDGAGACALLLLLLPTLEAEEPASRLLSRLDAVALASSGSSSRLALRVRIARAEVRSAAGDIPAAHGDLADALQAARQMRDAQLEARALAAVGLACWHQGDLRRAAEALAASRAAARAGNRPQEELLALRRSANLSLERGRLDEAERDLEAAKILARRLGDERSEAIALGTSSLVHHRAGRNDRASTDALEALSLMQRMGDTPRVAVTCSNLGVISQELGRYDEARRWHAEAAEAAHRAGDRRLLGFVHGCRGRLEHERGHPAAACAHFEEALRLLHDVQAARLCGLFQAALAAAEAEQGDHERAAAHLEHAAHALVGAEPHEAAVLDVYRAVVAAHGGIDAAASSPPMDHARALAARDEDVRIALALLDRARPPAPDAPAPATSRAMEEALVVAADGTWFRAPRSPLVELARRRNLRRVLVALSRARLQTPGRTLSVTDLVAAGWPGERILASAAQMRVYATLTRLRKLGLSEYLLSRADGYLLDARVPLAFADPDERA